MNKNYKSIITVSAAIITLAAVSISSYANETIAKSHNADYIASDLENWYSIFFTGSSYVQKSEEPVLAFSACASSEDIALMLASAALSTHDKTNTISSIERISVDSAYRLEIISKKSGIELDYVVLRKDQVRSAPPEVCVLITRE